MSNTYLIKLTPLDWYFLGGEKTFGNDNAEYLAHSNKLPQQSTLLGMLRFQLLKQKGWLFGKGGESDVDQNKIVDLIGENSFSIDEAREFGVIKNITPICIYDTSKENLKRFYIPQALDDKLNLSIDNNVKVCLNGVVKDCIVKPVDCYDHKTYSSFKEWRNIDDEVIEEDDIWTCKSQIGITKTTTGNDEKAFYKQTVLNFKEKFCFAFWVDVEEELVSDYVFIGAQRSCFKMDVIPIADINATKSYEAICNKSKTTSVLERVEICGDTFIEDLNELNRLCEFQLTDSIPFRNMEMKKRNGALKNGYISYDKIEVRFNLLKRGSVLYFKKEHKEEILNLINKKHLQLIGYNII